MEKTTPKRTLILSLAVGAVCLLAFGLVGAREWWLSLSPPSREPTFRGRIIEASSGSRYLLQSPQGDRYFFHLRAKTRVQTRTGEPATIAIGQNVSVWGSGPVMLSEPPQGHATWIIIEPDEPKEQP